MASGGNGDVSEKSKHSEETSFNAGEKEKPMGTNWTGGLFLASLTGFSMLFGFSLTVALAKKKDPAMFSKTLIPSREIPETGTSLALKALAWGTFYSVSGFSLFCYGVWKLLGARDLKEFRNKMGTLLPKLPKKEPQGRTEFKDLRDLLKYIIEQDESKKQSKKS